MSLYRIYRPQQFADVTGQDHIVTTLENAIEKGKLSHAYLFAGSRGTGKTSVARILAKAILTAKIQDETVRRQIHKGVEEGNLVDLLEIDAASNRGIDDIRDLVEKIQFSPVIASAKVYIIDEVHMLTKEAFNALLKTLEEPPTYAYFILATTERNKIPTTIQSRCQCFPFHAIREEDIVRRLQFIADNEKISAERDALRAIARHAEGGMRDAISLLDQLRSLEKITRTDVEQRIGSTGQEQVEAMLTAIGQGDSETIVRSIRALEEEGVPMDLFLRQLLGIIRHLLHEAVAAKESTHQYVHMIDTLLEAIRDARTSPLPGLAVEAALLSLTNANKDEQGSVSAPKQQPVVKETQVPETPKPDKKTVSQETQKQAAAVEAVELSETSVLERWPEILESITQSSVRMSLKNGRLTAVEGKNITVAFTSDFHRNKVAATEASRNIEKIMEKLFRQSVRLHCTVQEDRDQSLPLTQENNATVDLAEAAAEIF